MINEEILRNILNEDRNLHTQLEQESDFKIIAEIKKKISKNSLLVEKAKEYFVIQETIEWIKSLPLNEQKELEDSITESKKTAESILQEVQDLMIQNAESHLNKNIFLEIRAGTGGDEASLFASEMYIMYKKYANDLGLKLEEMEISYNEAGGIKSITIFIKGDWALKYFQFERGCHRVQRVPITEKKGRVHTSTITVAILPEEEESTESFNLNDVKIEYSTAQGAGGQHVNKTESAVILTHIPTGIKVKIQDERSQHKNKDKAFKILRFRVKEMLTAEEQKKLSDDRWSQLGTGERSEKIRTYNFPQNRLTDHRFNITLYNLPKIMEGGEMKDFFQQMLLSYSNGQMSHSTESNNE